MPELITQMKPKARKQHRCDLCTGPIRPGEIYERSALKSEYDGAVYDWVECPACVEDKVGVECADYGDPDAGYTHEDAQEWAHDNRDDDVVGEIARRFLARYGCDCEDCAPGPEEEGQ